VLRNISDIYLENWKGRGFLMNLCRDRGIMLKWILEKNTVWNCVLNSSGSGLPSVGELVDAVKNFVSRKMQGTVLPTEQTLKSSVFWDITPCCSLKASRRFGGICLLYQIVICLPPALTLAFCLAYTSILNIKAICSSETSVNFQQTALRYIPEGRTLHNHYC
jgi:hypothetical protein